MINKYVATFKIHIQESMQYFTDLIASGVITLIYVFAFYNLWSTIYQQHQVPGFTLSAMVWYLTIAQILRAGGGRPVKEISQTIQDGTIINYMNKPISFLWLQASTQIGRSFPTLISSTILCGIFVFLMLGAPQIKLITLPILILVLLMGILINFLMGFVIATTAFWIEDANPLHWVYEKVIFILGGFLFPIDLLPEIFMNIARYLPTSYFIYYPAKLFVNFEMNLFIEVIIGQIIYIILLILIAKYLLYKGTKKLSVNGG